MADVELVIKMPEDVFKRTAFYHELRYLDDYITIVKALEKATPLPKGHGRLIDADALWKKWVFDAIGKQEIDEAPTIIEKCEGNRHDR